MSTLDNIFQELQEVSENPQKAIEDFQKETGKGAVGVLPVYTPEEIIHAAGRLPVGIWGGRKPISKARTYLPAFACSIMQEIMELELEGAYDNLDAVLVSSPCDTLKCMGQKWKGKCPVIQFVHPQNRKLEAANSFLEEEYKIVRSKLERIFGEEISDAAIDNSIEVYNKNRAVMRKFVAAAAKHPEIVDPVRRHAVMKARFFMEKSKHTKLVEGLIEELEALPEEKWHGKRVILTGIMAEPNEILEMMKEFHIGVVADDLAQESRQFRADVPEGERPLYRLAKAWQNLEGCSLATDREKQRIPMLLDMVKRYHADAVIICMMKFCDPEEFDYPICYKKLMQENIRNLMIEIDQEATSFEQVKTRLQSFTEMLS